MFWINSISDCGVAGKERCSANLLPKGGSKIFFWQNLTKRTANDHTERHTYG